MLHIYVTYICYIYKYFFHVKHAVYFIHPPLPEKKHYNVNVDTHIY